MAGKTFVSFSDPLIRIAVSLLEDVSRQTIVLLGILLAGLLIVPWLVNDYLLTVLIVVLYFAFTGQAWNIMMGFAGQLSLGHPIYAGRGGFFVTRLFSRLGFALVMGLFSAVPHSPPSAPHIS